MARAVFRNGTRGILASSLGGCKSFLTVAAICGLTRLALAGDLNTEISFDIPAQPLAQALATFSRQADTNVAAPTRITSGKSSKAVKETTTATKALMRLLEGTGLHYRVQPDGTIVVGVESPNTTTDTTPAGGSRPSAEAKDVRSPSGILESGTDEPTGSASDKEVNLEEVVVTAQKRRERLIDTPQSATVLNASELSQSGVTQLRDFADTVPGLTINTLGAGNTQITLRGVTGGSDVSTTTAIYVDEVPYGANGPFGGSAFNTFDGGLFDLERVEVLRGPQGTLYGASSMGGLIKYVTKEPDLARFGGNAQVGAAGTNYGGVSYNVATAVNLPIVTNKLAVRASGYETHDGGYISNLALDDKSVNHSDMYGGRLDLLFEPIGPLSVRISGVLQNISRAGAGNADYTFTGAPIDGPLDQRRLTPEPLDQHFRLISATIHYNLGRATLTSISAYQIARTDFHTDFTTSYAPFLSSYLGRTYSAVQDHPYVSFEKFTQEMRLASTGTERFDWVIGAFYSHDTERLFDTFNLRDLVGRPAPNDLDFYLDPSHSNEMAGFADVTWRLTRRLDVTGGIRYARNTVSNEIIAWGLLETGVSVPFGQSTDHIKTYLANGRYHFSQDTMAYVRYATGYRPGGPNFVGTNPMTGLPLGSPSFQSDSLKSYEVGFKTETADRRLGIDTAIYDIEWSNIQVIDVIDTLGFVVNAPGGARIRGSELTLTARYPKDLLMTGAFAYQDAYLKEANALLGASQCERLPNVPKFTAALNADYTFANNSMQPTIGATVRYMDARWSSFNNSLGSPQYHLPDYATVDLRAGLRLSPVDFQLYARNLFDKRGQLSAVTYLGPVHAAIIQPLTIGFTLSTRF